jgi:cysteinyl-tRNA synthetase
VKHLVLEGRKMSKSLANTITVRELLERGYEPAAIRHQLLTAQYRRELNFTVEGLDASSRALQRLLDFEARLEEAATVEDAAHVGVGERARKAVGDFAAALDDDLNSADALGVLFLFVSDVNTALLRAGGRLHPTERQAALDALRSIDQVLGLLETARQGRTLDDETARWVERMIEERSAARKARDFGRADDIRDQLARRGIVLEDGPDGTRWKVVHQIEEAAASS